MSIRHSQQEQRCQAKQRETNYGGELDWVVVFCSLACIIFSIWGFLVFGLFWFCERFFSKRTFSFLVGSKEKEVISSTWLAATWFIPFSTIRGWPRIPVTWATLRAIVMTLAIGPKSSWLEFAFFFMGIWVYADSDAVRLSRCDLFRIAHYFARFESEIWI